MMEPRVNHLTRLAFEGDHMRAPRPLAAVVAITGLALLAGCSGKADPAASGSTGGAKAFAGTDSITVGLIAPMTGPFAVLGISEQNSLNVIIDSVNAAGGVGGAKLKLETRDQQLDPGKAVQIANEFAGNKQVKLVVGPSLTSFYNAAKGAFESNKTVNCQPTVAAGTFSDLNYGFRSQDPNVLNLEQMLAYLKGAGKKSIGLVYEADDTGAFFDGLLKEKAPQHGMTYAGWQQSRTDDTSHVSYVQALSKADAIWISSNISGAKTMAAKAETNYPGTLVGGSGLFNIAFVEAAGDAAAGTLYSSSNYQWNLRDKSTWQPGYKAHIDEVVKRYGQNVGPKSGATSPKGTGLAADCVFAYARAAEAANSVDPQAVATAMEALSIPASETPSGNGIHPGKGHEFYGKDDIHIYRWMHDGQGWYAEESSS